LLAERPESYTDRRRYIYCRGRSSLALSRVGKAPCFGKIRGCSFSLLFSLSLLVIYYTRSKELLILSWKELGFRESGQLGWSESFRKVQENVLDPNHKEWFNINSKQRTANRGQQADPPRYLAVKRRWWSFSFWSLNVAVCPGNPH
jgi:hypothetical protein